MGVDGEVLKLIAESKREYLGEDKGLGLRHELIGKSCLYHASRNELFPAVPYRAFEADGELRLSVLWYGENEGIEGEDVKVKAMSLRPGDLIPLDPSSQMGQQVYNTVLSWLASNRAGTFSNPRAKED